MKKLFYIVLVLIVLMVAGRVLKSHFAPTAATTESTETVTTGINKQPVVEEDEHGNVTVDGEAVEEVEENTPEDTGGEEETIVAE